MRKAVWKRPYYKYCFFGLLIIGGILVLLPYYPAVQYQARQAAKASPLKAVIPQSLVKPVTVDPDELAHNNWVVIPSINVKAEIQEGDSIAILNTKEGVWHQVGSYTSGNLVLAGHRFQYLPPNTQTFYNLDKLREGDEIFLYKDGVKNRYVVTKHFEVTSDQVDILNPTSTPQLTLYTCKDLSYAKRLVVIAVPKG